MYAFQLGIFASDIGPECSKARMEGREPCDNRGMRDAVRVASATTPSASNAGTILWVWYTPFGLGGVETFLLNLSREAVASGWNVAVAAAQSAEGRLVSDYESLAVGRFD